MSANRDTDPLTGGGSTSDNDLSDEEKEDIKQDILEKAEGATGGHGISGGPRDRDVGRRGGAPNLASDDDPGVTGGPFESGDDDDDDRRGGRGGGGAAGSDGTSDDDRRENLRNLENIRRTVARETGGRADNVSVEQTRDGRGFVATFEVDGQQFVRGFAPGEDVNFDQVADDVRRRQRRTGARLAAGFNFDSQLAESQAREADAVDAVNRRPTSEELTARRTVENRRAGTLGGSQDPAFRGDIFVDPAQQVHVRERIEQQLLAERGQAGEAGVIELETGEVEFFEEDGVIKARVPGREAFDVGGRLTPTGQARLEAARNEQARQAVTGQGRAAAERQQELERLANEVGTEIETGQGPAGVNRRLAGGFVGGATDRDEGVFGTDLSAAELAVLTGVAADTGRALETGQGPIQAARQEQLAGLAADADVVGEFGIPTNLDEFAALADEVGIEIQTGQGVGGVTRRLERRRRGVFPETDLVVPETIGSEAGEVRRIGAGTRVDPESALEPLSERFQQAVVRRRDIIPGDFDARVRALEPVGDVATDEQEALIEILGLEAQIGEAFVEQGVIGSAASLLDPFARAKDVENIREATQFIAEQTAAGQGGRLVEFDRQAPGTVSQAEAFAAAEAGALPDEAEELRILEGGAAGATEQVTRSIITEQIEGLERALAEEPIETSAALAGSLVGTGALIGGASALSRTAGRGTAFLIQPGEELATFGASRAAPGLAARFPGGRIDNEEIILRGLARAGRGLRARGADVAAAARRGAGRVEVEPRFGAGLVPPRVGRSGELDLEEELTAMEERIRRQSVENRRITEASRQAGGPSSRFRTDPTDPTFNPEAFEQRQVTEIVRQGESGRPSIRFQPSQFEFEAEDIATEFGFGRFELNQLEDELLAQVAAQRLEQATEQLVDQVEREVTQTDQRTDVATETELETEQETETELRAELDQLAAQVAAERDVELEGEFRPREVDREQELETETELEFEPEAEAEAESFVDFEALEERVFGPSETQAGAVFSSGIADVEDLEAIGAEVEAAEREVVEAGGFEDIERSILGGETGGVGVAAPAEPAAGFEQAEADILDEGSIEALEREILQGGQSVEAMERDILDGVE